MTLQQRLTAIKRLRKAAQTRRGIVAAWRAFPECSRDEEIPDPTAILEICDRMEREQADDEAFAERMRAR